jgi:rSAM/selenodomain-associated transferase 1
VRGPTIPPTGSAADGCLLLFTKPAVAGRVKTRLVGPLTPEQAASLHAAFLADLAARLAGGEGYELRVAWALEPGESVPVGPLPGIRQQGEDLGERLFTALSGAATEAPLVAAIGSDHPDLSRAVVEEAFDALRQGAPVVLGPALDGGYYLVGARREALSPRLFAGVPWSGPQVLAVTLARCRELGITPRLLAPQADVDTPADFARLAARAARGELSGCPCTSALLASWRTPETTAPPFAVERGGMA